MMSIPKRYQIAGLAFIGMTIVYGAQYNLDTAINYFLENSNKNASNTALKLDKELNDLKDSLEVFRLADMFMLIIGGLLAIRFHATRVFGISIGIFIILNGIIPLVITINMNINDVVLMIVKLQGLIEGIIYSSCIGIWRYWSPKLETTILASIPYAGIYFGKIVGMLLSNFLTEKLNWTIMFEFYGLFGLVWFILWWIFVSDRPNECRGISDKEKDFIEDNIDEDENEQWIRPRLCSILSSKAFWSLLITMIAHIMALFLILYRITEYDDKSFGNIKKFKVKYGFDISDLVLFLVIIIGGVVSDLMRRNMSTTLVRKLFLCVCLSISGILLVIATYIHESYPTLMFVFMGICTVLNGFTFVCSLANHLDLSPRYASFIFGITYTLSVLIAAICLVFLYLLSYTKQMKPGDEIVTNLDILKNLDWRYLFKSAALAQFLGVFIYGVFGSGVKQNWSSSS